MSFVLQTTIERTCVRTFIAFAALPRSSKTNLQNLTLATFAYDPVTAIARTVEINIWQLLGEKDVPAPLPYNGF
ncbi:hypothetical protein [Rufibacter sp. XAAS-G3-1]|uniref:hypothetical protein n=1 Tax=Rufibacter sp. XAAS-G3-1 TaxID=2729134 RepID=UPI0015E70690|nr:hypothetical protein [Rufibacter sp. XAAS-G3-1]